jgi:hypothetical protein
MFSFGFSQVGGKKTSASGALTGAGISAGFGALDGSGISAPVGMGGSSQDMVSPTSQTYPPTQDNILGGNDGHEPVGNSAVYESISQSPLMKGDAVIVGAGMAAAMLLLVGMVIIWKT